MGVHLLDAKIPDGQRVYAVGDVHGCLGQLERLLKLIKLDLHQTPIKKHYLVFVGDYVDRGPDSAGVIECLVNLQATTRRVICLMGNHEEKFLGFLADPQQLAPGFFAYGGIETSQSYGVTDDQMVNPVANAQAIRQLLIDKIPSSHLRFLRKLKMSFSIGDYFFCHAGIRPGIALEKQSAHDLRWIRHEFLNHAGLHEKIIVHGHTPGSEPEVLANRINVDTECYASGVLTCLVLEGQGQRFLHT